MNRSLEICPICGWDDIEGKETCPNCGSWLGDYQLPAKAAKDPASVPEHAADLHMEEDAVLGAMTEEAPQPAEPASTAGSIPLLDEENELADEISLEPIIEEDTVSEEAVGFEDSASLVDYPDEMQSAAAEKGQGGAVPPEILPPSVLPVKRLLLPGLVGLFLFVFIAAFLGGTLLRGCEGGSDDTGEAPAAQVIFTDLPQSERVSSQSNQTPRSVPDEGQPRGAPMTSPDAQITPDVNAISTAAAQTVIARLTQEADVPSSTPVRPTSTSPPATSTPRPLTPTPAGPTGLIAFNSNRSGNNDIYVMNADGSNITQLTTDTSDDRVPSWSPDGKLIAFQSNQGGDYEITVVNLESRQIRQVTNNSCDDYNPVWSPDGQRLAFYSDCDGNREIYTIRADGSDRRQITQTSGVYNWFPNWSPDGRQIVFASNRSAGYQVWMMNADGSNARALAPGCLASFSPDGEWLVFTEYCSDLGGLYSMRPDGSRLKVLDEQYNSTNPSWSPDGRRIIFQSDRSGNEEIWMMDTDGSDWLQLTTNSARDAAPVWQPGR